jgi:hypothetical protein
MDKPTRALERLKARIAITPRLQVTCVPTADLTAIAAYIEELEGAVAVHKDRIDDYREIILQLEPPPGFALVPIEPTEAMLDAAHNADAAAMERGPAGATDEKPLDARYLQRAAWFAMIEAALSLQGETTAHKGKEP